jgi:hypothetical protein
MFRRITSMEPLLPAGGAGELAELSVEIFKKSGELTAALPRNPFAAEWRHWFGR